MISLMEVFNRMIAEKMTYSQLFNTSDPARKTRSKDVSVTKLPVMASSNGWYWNFAYTSNPSTTGKSWKGRINFRRTNEVVDADSVPCTVDCSCPDYRYRWAYANDRRDAGAVGVRSLNKSWPGSKPVITNPQIKPGLCKHLLALKNELHQRLNTSKRKYAYKRRNIHEMLDEIVAQYPTFEITYEE